MGIIGRYWFEFGSVPTDFSLCFQIFHFMLPATIRGQVMAQYCDLWPGYGKNLARRRLQ